MTFNPDAELVTRCGAPFEWYHKERGHGVVKDIDRTWAQVFWTPYEGVCWYQGISKPAWDLIEKPSTLKPWPQKGDICYYSNGGGGISSLSWDGDVHPKLEQGLFSPTREAEELAAEKRRTAVKLRKLLDEVNGPKVQNMLGDAAYYLMIIPEGQLAFYNSFNRLNEWALYTDSAHKMLDRIHAEIGLPAIRRLFGLGE